MIIVDQCPVDKTYLALGAGEGFRAWTAGDIHTGGGTQPGDYTLEPSGAVTFQPLSVAGDRHLLQAAPIPTDFSTVDSLQETLVVSNPHGTVGSEPGVLVGDLGGVYVRVIFNSIGKLLLYIEGALTEYAEIYTASEAVNVSLGMTFVAGVASISLLVDQPSSGLGKSVSIDHPNPFTTGTIAVSAGTSDPVEWSQHYRVGTGLESTCGGTPTIPCPLGQTYAAIGAGVGYRAFVGTEYTLDTSVNPDGSIKLTQPPSATGYSHIFELETGAPYPDVFPVSTTTQWEKRYRWRRDLSGTRNIYSVYGTSGIGLSGRILEVRMIGTLLEVLAGDTVLYTLNGSWQIGDEFSAEVVLAISEAQIAVSVEFSEPDGQTHSVQFDFAVVEPYIHHRHYTLDANLTGCDIDQEYIVGQGFETDCQGEWGPPPEMFQPLQLLLPNGEAWKL
jgi:hypothetical protein